MTSGTLQWLYQASLPHLKAELGLAPRVAGSQLCRSRIVLQHLQRGKNPRECQFLKDLIQVQSNLTHHGSLDRDSSFPDSHVHRQVKQLQRRMSKSKKSFSDLGVPMPHPIFGEEKPHQLTAAHILAHHHLKCHQYHPHNTQSLTVLYSMSGPRHLA